MEVWQLQVEQQPEPQPEPEPEPEPEPAEKMSGAEQAAGGAAGSASQELDELVSQYKLGELIARGTAASVRKAVCASTGAPIAVKVLRGVKAEWAENEAAMLRAVHDHPSVVELLDVVRLGDETSLVMPLAGGGDLERALSQREAPFDEGTARHCFRQIIGALRCCHERGIAHGDIKLENILVDGEPWNLLLCDFGCATSARTRSDVVGTRHYVAPEIVQDSPSYDGQAADIFSAGVLLYTMLVGHFPFERPPLTALNSRATRAAGECRNGLPSPSHHAVV